MTGRSKVEVTRQYATTVETLQDAFVFIMERVESVGDAPSVTISPMWVYSHGDGDGHRRFEVSVSGMVEES